MTGSPPQLGGTRPVADSGPLSDTRPEKKPRLTASEPKNVGRKSSKKSSARKGKKRQNLPEAYSPDDVLWRDVIDLLGKDVVEAALEEGLEWESPFGFREQVEVDVKSLSSAGESIFSWMRLGQKAVLSSMSIDHLLSLGTSLALAPHPHKPWAVITPFALPGEKIRVRVYRNSRLHSYADLINVTQPNPALRDMTRVRCRYFGECAGCQYQVRAL
jgi:tRNA (uracil-5-)-methyltransferase